MTPARSLPRLLLAALASMAAMGQPAAAQSVIEQGSLSELDAWNVGALGRGEPALPRSLWANSDPAGLALLFDRVPANLVSPAGVRVTRQALLSPAFAPQGDALLAARKRYETLARLGAADELVSMVSGSGEAKRDAAISLYVTQAELARGRLRDACRRADAVQPDSPPPFVLRLKALCLAAGGEKEGADLALEVARTAGAGDPWFQTAIAALNGAPPARAPLGKYDTSLNAAASTLAKLRPPPKDALANASMFALAIVARNEDAPAALRAQAAMGGLRQLALPIDAARAAARADMETKTPSPLTLAVREAESAAGPYAQALAIEGALKRAKSHAEFAAFARLFESDIARLPQDPGAAPAALTFSRALLTTGNLNGALAWRRLVVAAPADATAIIDLALAIAGGDSESARQAGELRIATATPLAAGLVARDLMALRALDLGAGAAAQDFLARTPMARGRKPDPALMAQFAAAVQRSAAGEAALYAGILLGDGAETLEPSVLVEVLQGLRAAGLDGVARSIAVEAVIGGQAR